MNRLATISATALLGCTLALTGCSSDDSKDAATKAGTAATNAGASMKSSASEVSESVADDASSASENATGDASQTGAAMPSMNAHTCDFDVSGSTAKGATTDLSCDDAKAIWAKVKEKSTTGQEQVEYNGETYECDMASLNGKTSASCHSGSKLFAFTGM